MIRLAEITSLRFAGRKDFAVFVVEAASLGRCAQGAGSAPVAATNFQLRQGLFFRTLALH